MSITFDLIDLLLFILLGFLAGNAAAALEESRYSRRKNRTRNTIIGMVGAIIGTILFNALDIQLSGALARGITLADLIVAFIGALLLIVLLNGIRR